MASQNIDPTTVVPRRKETTESVTGKKDNHSVTKRLQHDLVTLMKSGSKDVSAFPNGDDMFNWIATINGSKNTAYEDLTFKLSLAFPSGYPYIPPTVKFVTPIFHPNVDQHGNICLDILKEKWSPLYTVSTILISLQSLLGEPNNESPLNVQAAEMWEDQTKFKRVVREKYEKKPKGSTR
ncbi:probable ubiquitin-conjugating enzyme E2 C [Anneissia japonica]|uniref:probable ubiquitin-conjugating enzyme E2 C n=1 Tax=Anneissia japonica TaxID=1529436 RepID=UPI0014257EF9|nr:probable ubiquitin-conjugating enzyme E2 C [Anneissia japonica]